MAIGVNVGEMTAILAFVAAAFVFVSVEHDSLSRFLSLAAAVYIFSMLD
jgi:hypothetical protein